MLLSSIIPYAVPLALHEGDPSLFGRLQFLHLSYQFIFCHGGLRIGDLVDVAYDALFIDQKGATALEPDPHFVQPVAPVDGSLRVGIDQHGKRQLEPGSQALSALAAACKYWNSMRYSFGNYVR
jgi:hypothetical protein